MKRLACISSMGIDIEDWDIKNAYRHRYYFNVGHDYIGFRFIIRYGEYN